MLELYNEMERLFQSKTVRFSVVVVGHIAIQDFSFQ